jgi:hypothetical protein
MALTEESLAPHSALGSDIDHLPSKEVFDPLPLNDTTAEKTEHLLNGHTGITAAFPNGIIYKEEKPSTDRSKYSIAMDDKLAFTARKLRVITVGAGFSGLLMAHKFQHRFPEMDKIVEHTIFEKRADFGGTWLVNTYPGVQCDVPSHIYVRIISCQHSSWVKQTALLTKRYNIGIPI